MFLSRLAIVSLAIAVCIAAQTTPSYGSFPQSDKPVPPDQKRTLRVGSAPTTNSIRPSSQSDSGA